MIQIYEELPEFPKHTMHIIKSYEESNGFISAKSADVEFHYSNSEEKKLMRVDYVTRRGSLDAVAILAWCKLAGSPYVYLRSCIRPALALRNWQETGRGEPYALNQWEIPAGIIDADEVGSIGVLNAASRELKEEIGGYVNPTYINKLGSEIFSSVGFSGERIYFTETELNIKHIETATLDGSPLEDNAEIILVSLKGIINAINMGRIRDSKTIIAIERFKRMNEKI